MMSSRVIDHHFDCIREGCNRDGAGKYGSSRVGRHGSGGAVVDLMMDA